MPGLDMMNQQRPDDQEAAMARADLYKLANYSFKLFKMIKDGDQLEGWVQAKVTKAADYIASVYHYLEYEMKFSEYGSKLENSDVYSETVKRMYVKKLTEAKSMLDKLKERAQQMEDFDADAKVGSEKKTRTGVATKTSTGLVHKNTSYKDGEDDIATNAKSGKGTKSHAKGQSAEEKKNRAPALKQSPKSAKTWGMKDSEKFDNRDGAAAKPKKVKEGSIQGGVWVASPDKGVPAPSDPDGGSAKPLKPGQPGSAAQMLKNKQAPKVSMDPSKRGVTPGSSKRTAGSTMEGKGDGNLANNAKPYDKVTRGDVIAGRLGKDAKGGKVKEELKGGQTKLDKNHNGKLDSDDFKKLRGGVKEAAGKCNHTPKGKSCPVHGLKECGGMYEASHQEKTTMKHVNASDASPKVKAAIGKAAKDIKPGVKGYGDRAAALNAAGIKR